MASPQFDRFKKTLSELFMLDQADLDFGIYRIMNEKRSEIETYLNTRLPLQVKQLLDENTSNRSAELKKQLDEAIKQAAALGVDPDNLPKVKALREQIAASGNADELESTVYAHLATFFGRYYEGGDFISLRRYKKDVYAIPYEGEEVKLHWANADQYYIKTGEFFRNYSFTLSDGKRVIFTLKDASTNQNNNIEQDNTAHYFALYSDCPISVDGNNLHINFTYEVYPKSRTAQKNFLVNAYNTVRELIPSDFHEVWALRPTDKDSSRTLLLKHLNDYVARNTFDYFIHKDLLGFLSRELDFYIKNEILVIDDINSRDTDEFIKHLSVIKAVKAVGKSLIQFLAQLENFQKRLWLKKKFVVQADYCITLDRVPAELYEEICRNDRQREEWVNLFAIDELKGDIVHPTAYSVPLTKNFLKENPFLVLDTQFFSTEFKHHLLSLIPDLDEQTDGLLINSENFQALNLLQGKYRQQVKCIYIDPPYNAKSSEILYKNTFKHASWLSLMENRLRLGQQLLSEDFTHFIAIDEIEQIHLGELVISVFDQQVNACLSIIHNPRGQQGKNISYIHEFAYVTYPSDKEKYLADVKRAEIDSRTLRDSGTESDRTDAATCFYPILVKNGEVIGFGEVPDDSFHPTSNNVLRADGVMEIWPIDDNGNEKKWRYGRETVPSIKEKLTVKSGRSSYQIIFNQDMGVMKSLWVGAQYDASEYGTKVIQNILGIEGAKKFSYPKSINTVTNTVEIGINGSKHCIILDYFGGSGTTGHAVINLNRKDNGTRKYILVEMGDYFETVTKPRIEKIVYSNDWNNGKPVSREGSSHCFKYMRLEQYEDTLNNLVMQQPSVATEGEFFDGFLLGYMLDVETSDSLFNLKWFVNPFDVKLRITRNNETADENIDLVETFNYLIGLNVAQISWPKQGICVVEGTTRQGKKTLVIWRNRNIVDNKALNDFFSRSAYSVRDNEFDTIFVNGDNNLENLRTDEDTWKVTLIEQEFNRRMWE